MGSMRGQWIIMTGVLIGLSAVGATASRAEAADIDLVVTGIVPDAMNKPEVTVIIQNLGSSPLREPVDVELRLDEKSIGRQRIQDAVPSKKSVFVKFQRPVKLSDGLHNLLAAIDPDNKIKELVEHNNEGGITIYWGKVGRQE